MSVRVARGVERLLHDGDKDGGFSANRCAAAGDAVSGVLAKVAWGGSSGDASDWTLLRHDAVLFC
jgi:hypothetical protein